MIKLLTGSDQEADRCWSTGWQVLITSADRRWSRGWQVLFNWLTGANEAADRWWSTCWQVLIKQLIGADKAADRCWSRGCKDIHEMRGLWTLRHINRALSIGIKLSRMGNTSPIVLQSMRRGCIFDGEGNLPASFRWRPRWIAKPGIQTFEIWEGEDFQ